MTGADVTQFRTLEIREAASELSSREIELCHHQAIQLLISLKIVQAAVAVAAGAKGATGPG